MCDRSSASALMCALVMTSVVLRRVRNCRRIIIIIIIIIRAGHGGAKRLASDTGANFHLNT